MDPDPCRWEGSIFRCFFKVCRVCVLFRKTRRRRLSEDGIMFSPPSPVLMVCLASPMSCGGVSSTDPSLIDLLGSGRSLSSFMCVFKLDLSDLRYSSSVTIDVLVR